MEVSGDLELRSVDLQLPLPVGDLLDQEVVNDPDHRVSRRQLQEMSHSLPLGLPLPDVLLNLNFSLLDHVPLYILKQFELPCLNLEVLLPLLILFLVVHHLSLLPLLDLSFKELISIFAILGHKVSIGFVSIGIPVQQELSFLLLPLSQQFMQLFLQGLNTPPLLRNIVINLFINLVVNLLS